MKAAGMVPLTLNDADMKALVSYLTSLGGTSAASVAAPPASSSSSPAPAKAKPAATTAPVKAGTGSSAASSLADNKSPEKSDKSVDLLSFIKSLFADNKTTEKATPGEKIYQSHGCVACHGEGGKGTQRASALIDFGKQLSPSQIMSFLKNPTVKMKAGGMPPVTGSDEELTSLVTYLGSLKSSPASPEVESTHKP